MYIVFFVSILYVVEVNFIKTTLKLKYLQKSAVE